MAVYMTDLSTSPTPGPPEICPEHDLRIDEYGCWACGHGGPLTEDIWPTFARWMGAHP